MSTVPLPNDKLMHFSKNNFFFLLLFCFCFGTYQSQAQDSTIPWIKAHAQPLQLAATADFTDLNFLGDVLANKTVVALGEASHGTKEFYTLKSRLVKYLVSKENFRTLAIEADVDFIEPINQYILTGRGEVLSALKTYGLYNSKALFALIEWLREFNQSQGQGGKVNLLGVDRQDYWSDPLGRDSLMAKDLLAAYDKQPSRTILWGHNLHLVKDTSMSSYEAMGYHLAKRLGRDYYVVLLDTDHGSTSAISNSNLETYSFESRENTMSSLLAKVPMDAFFLELGKSPNPFYQQTTLITTIYANWQNGPIALPAVPGIDYDAILFIRETSASTFFN